MSVLAGTLEVIDYGFLEIAAIRGSILWSWLFPDDVVDQLKAGLLPLRFASFREDPFKRRSNDFGFGNSLCGCKGFQVVQHRLGQLQRYGGHIEKVIQSVTTGNTIRFRNVLPKAEREYLPRTPVSFVGFNPTLTCVRPA
jgi:hypothetical protein